MKVAVSALIVSYNVKPLLLDALRALQNEARLNLETLVVDNASTDGSADAVEHEFPDARVVRLETNVGFGNANNVAATLAQGEFFLLLNPDVVVAPGCVSRLTDFLRRHPEAGAAGPRLVRPDGRPDLAGRRGFPSPASAFYRLSGLSRVFPASPRFNRYNLGHLSADEEHEIDAGTAACLLVRRAAVSSAAGISNQAAELRLFDPTFFMYGEDLDLCFRLRNVGWKIFYVPEAIAVHAKGASSRQQTRRMLYEFHRAMWLFHQKHYSRQLPALANAAIWASIWGRWLVLTTRAAVTGDPRVSI
jgi:GT2 family glycosyltransferase